MQRVRSEMRGFQVPWYGILLMVVFSFGNLVGIPVSGLVIPIGVITFFIHRAVTKDVVDYNSLNLQDARGQIITIGTWKWLLLPVLVSGINVIISSTFLPGYILYEMDRVNELVPTDLSIISIASFFVFALGEEIAWRAFFQRQLNLLLPIVPVILGSSLLFTLGHFSSGNLTFILYGMFFTFINSCLYGFIFYRTKNVWLSTIAHFLANIFELTLYLLI